MVSTADFKNVWYKRQYVASVQNVVITDEHGLQRTYVYPNNRFAEPGETLTILYNEWATMDSARWEVQGPE
jgi:hypothetical protein